MELFKVHFIEVNHNRENISVPKYYNPFNIIDKTERILLLATA